MRSTSYSIALISMLAVTAVVYADPLTVPGTANPWFAGATNGTADGAGDNAPAESPVLVTNLTIVPGHVLTFQATGSVDTSGNPPFWPPDGGGTIHHGLSPDGSENGIAGVTAPVDALLGVFLDSAEPVLSAIPGALDFTTPESQNYATLAPALKQVFFIGDGTNGIGALQRVTVPGGATRLYLGGMDGGGWYNNSGSFSVLVSELASAGPTIVPGAGNPWLAGATNGTPAAAGDIAPDESPVLVTNLTIVPGHILTFQATGLVDYSGGTPTDPPDGETGTSQGHNSGTLNGSENGIAGVHAPVDALIGVFLDNAEPDLSDAPDPLDFGTPESVNYATLAPALKQVFFIGDGTNDVGALQRVTVPGGATRLFLGTMDGSGWYNNTGTFSVLISDIGSAGPRITGIRILNRTNLVLNATGGSAGHQVLVLTSTNVTLPMANWSHFATNNFDFAGALSLSNGITAGERQRFFRLLTY